MPENNFKHFSHIDSFGHRSTLGELSKGKNQSALCVAKTTLLKLDNTYAMAILPIDRQLDLERIKNVAKAKEVWVIAREDLSSISNYEGPKEIPLPDSNFDVEVFADQIIVNSREIAFATGVADEVIIMDLEVYISIVRPIFASIADVTVRG